MVPERRETRAGYAALNPLCARQPIASIEEAGTKTLATQGELTSPTHSGSEHFTQFIQKYA